jgi:hypothetical protein
MFTGAMMMNSNRATVGVAVTLLVGWIGLCGCRHQYIIRLRNGEQILSPTKPKLEGTNYYYSAGGGTKYAIPRSHVVNIRSASVKKVEEQWAPSQTPASPKKPKHWYFLWLA